MTFQTLEAGILKLIWLTYNFQHLVTKLFLSKWQHQHVGFLDHWTEDLINDDDFPWTNWNIKINDLILTNNGICSFQSRLISIDFSFNNLLNANWMKIDSIRFLFNCNCLLNSLNNSKTPGFTLMLTIAVFDSCQRLLENILVFWPFHLNEI